MINSVKPILSTENLTVGYQVSGKGIPILEDINVSLLPGQLVCFMGPNGVGKSTLIRSITGIQKAISGKVIIDGKPLSSISNEDLAKLMSVVLTDKINAANLSVYELVALGRYPYMGWNVSFSKNDIEKIEKAVETTNITHLTNKKVFELSDGQLQKVMIARALSQDTPIVILDEPTAHLDLNNRVEVINLLSELAKNSNKAILMATHELDLALQSADRLWLAGPNEPIIDGFPEDLVLNGKIDKVFQLKGFDLKTGRLALQKGLKPIQLAGNGHNYLWTKNALERNGFFTDKNAPIEVEILESDKIRWKIKKESEQIVSTLEELIDALS